MPKQRREKRPSEPRSANRSRGDFAVAASVRAVVEREGQEAPRFLYEAFDEINRDFFRGKLPPAAILLTPPSSVRALGDHIAVDEHGIRYRVRISPGLTSRGERFLRDVLLHELVHVAHDFFGGEPETGYRGHGPEFARRCNEIGSKLGLPEVAAKGKRVGKPDCAQWPLNVRPPGYYGFDPEERGQRRTKDAGEDKQDDQDDDKKAARHAGEVIRQAYRVMRAALNLLQEGDTEGAEGILKSALGDE